MSGQSAPGDRFVVEADRRVIGIAVRVPGGFRFYSSDPDYQELEARTFPRARAIRQRIAELGRRRRGRSANSLLPAPRR